MSARMVHLGYGKWVRADRVYALVPLGPDERGEGRRTYVHIEGVEEPLVASRSERAILASPLSRHWSLRYERSPRAASSTRRRSG